MTRRILLALLVLVLAVALPATWLMTSEAGLRWAFAALAARVPGLGLQTLQGRLIGPIRITGLHYRDAAADVQMAELSVDWTPLTLLAGRVRLTQAHGRGLRVTLPVSPGPLQLPDVRLPVSVSVSDLALEDIVLAQGGAVPIHVARFGLAASLRAGTVFIRRLTLHAPALDIGVRGRLTPHANYPLDVDVRWTAKLAGHPSVSGQGKIAGDLQSLRISQHIREPLNADLAAEVRTPLTDLHWDAALKLVTVPVAQLRPGWPAANLHGEFRGHGNQSTLDAEGTLALAARAGSHLAVTAHADWSQPDRPARFDVGAEWREIVWPPTGDAVLASPRGTLRAHGTANRYAIRVDTDLMHARAGKLQLTGDANGGRTMLTVRQLQLHALDGVLQGHGDLGWQPGWSWHFAFEGHELDPGRLWPQWPGRLAITGSSDGMLDKTLTARLAITQANGTLRDQPVSLVAEAGVAGQHYTLGRFALRAGSARVQAAGSVTDRWDFTWDLQADELVQLLPDASGALATKGHVSGARAAPAISATLTGRDLGYRDYRIDAISAEADVDLADTRDSRLTLAAREISALDYRLRTLNVSAQGRASRHSITAMLAEERAELRLAADGQLQKTGWHGTFRQAALISPAYGDWTLEQPADVMLSRSQSTLRQTCWQWQDARVCGAAQWQQAKGWAAELLSQRLPTSVFAGWLASGPTLHGTLDATMRLHMTPVGRLSGDVAVTASPGTISLPGTAGTPTVLDYRAGRLDARIADERFDASLQLRLADGGNIDAALAAPVRADAHAADDSQPLRGHLKGEIRDLRIASIFFPQFEQARGSLSADVALGGTLAHPRVSGRAHLEHGELDIGRFGVRLREARLSANSTDSSTVEITGQVNSGGGVLRIAGQGDVRPANWRAALKLDGENFEVVKTPEVWLRVSPALTLLAQPGEVNLQGALRVPEGRFVPKDVSQAVTVSPDAVIVDATSGAAVPPQRWRVHTRVQVSLGDKVRVEAYSFKGWVTGTVTAVDEPQKATTGTGEVRFVAGTYEVYGTKLNIDSGRLVFTGGPIADPGLDVRAVRRVGDVLAGVQARGTLNHPELTLFSEPPMDQAEALSYLMLGKPTRQAAAADGELLTKAATSLGFAGGERLARHIGQVFGIEEVRIESGATAQSASLMLGTYLSPRLYVNYGIGLFETVNTLRLRYDISKHWQIQTETGIQSGADLLYTIER
jgi:translocation and assembly module TamB